MSRRGRDAEIGNAVQPVPEMRIELSRSHTLPATPWSASSATDAGGAGLVASRDALGYELDYLLSQPNLLELVR